MAGLVIILIISIVFLIIVAAKTRRNNKDTKTDTKENIRENIPNMTKIHNVVCPFCYSEFSPQDVRFYFEMNGVVKYISANPNASAAKEAEETKAFLVQNNMYGKIKVDDNGMPVCCELLSKHDNRVKYRSSIRVCADNTCNQVLSSKAGTYAADNGVFVIGLKSSGKTVYITSVINRLANVLPKYFRCGLRAYNADVAAEYQNNYYNIMYTEKKLPDATVSPAQLTYEVESGEKCKTVGITFSDIKGEVASNVLELMGNEDINKVISHSSYFLLTLDITDLNHGLTADIINHVLSLATIDPARKPYQYLAVVITKSDALANELKDPVFSFEGLNIAGRKYSIYNNVRYDEQGFNDDRKAINSMLRNYMMQSPELAGLVIAAENVFLPQNVNYFAVSALGHKPGADGRIDNIQPIRVEEPILWLLDNSGILR